MRIRITAVAAAVSIGLAATPSFAQGYAGSAASTAYTLGATASPGLQANPFPPPLEPAPEAEDRDVLITGSTVRHAPHTGTHTHHR